MTKAKMPLFLGQENMRACVVALIVWEARFFFCLFSSGFIPINLMGGLPFLNKGDAPPEDNYTTLSMVAEANLRIAGRPSADGPRPGEGHRGNRGRGAGASALHLLII